MKISIVIPAINETSRLSVLLPELSQRASKSHEMEVFVVDASSDSSAKEICEQCNVLYIESEKAQRAYQMNLGASKSESDLLYFLHADSLPPHKFDDEIIASISDSEGGCFRMRFDDKHPIMSLYAFFTRFKGSVFHGGDASLFVTRSLFDKVQGFDENLDLMEDYSMVNRIKYHGKFTVLKSSVITSARKYKTNGVLRLQWIYLLIHLMYAVGMSQEKLKKFYKKHIR